MLMLLLEEERSLDYSTSNLGINLFYKELNSNIIISFYHVYNLSQNEYNFRYSLLMEDLFFTNKNIGLSFLTINFNSYISVACQIISQALIAILFYLEVVMTHKQLSLPRILRRAGAHGNKSCNL